MKSQILIACAFLLVVHPRVVEAQEVTQNGGTTVEKTELATSANTMIAANGITRDIAAGEAIALPAAPMPVAMVQPVTKELTGRERQKADAKQMRIWRGLVFADHSAAFFDAWSTRQSITSGNGYERDPLMKPFANSAAIYPMLQLAPLGADFLGRRLMRSNHEFVRKIWWVPQTLSFGSSMWVGARNLNVAGLKR